VVDFDLGMMEFDSVQPTVVASAGTVKGVSIDRLPEGNVARVGFHFLPGDAPNAEFRLSLETEGVQASEIWLYRWSA
jgi:glucan biosynthesis protein